MELEREGSVHETTQEKQLRDTHTHRCSQGDCRKLTAKGPSKLTSLFDRKPGSLAACRPGAWTTSPAGHFLEALGVPTCPESFWVTFVLCFSFMMIRDRRTTQMGMVALTAKRSNGALRWPP